MLTAVDTYLCCAVITTVRITWVTTRLPSGVSIDKPRVNGNHHLRNPLSHLFSLPWTLIVASTSCGMSMTHHQPWRGIFLRICRLRDDPRHSLLV
jgi:hypothetical protein